MHTQTYTYTIEYYSAVKKNEQNFVICNNLDVLKGHYAKWNKSEQGKLLYDITSMWNLKNTAK